MSFVNLYHLHGPYYFDKEIKLTIGPKDDLNYNMLGRTQRWTSEEGRRKRLGKARTEMFHVVCLNW